MLELGDEVTDGLAGTEHFNLGRFLARWAPKVKHDLTASDSETISLAKLLQFAGSDDRSRWDKLELCYTEPSGAIWLREAIAARHVSLNANEVVCCSGAQEAMTCAIRTLLKAGDHAIIILPIYQPSEHAVTGSNHATGVLLAGEDWTLDVERINAALRPNTKLILPNSPTGASIDSETLSALIEVCRRRGIWLVNDEVYRQTDSVTECAPMVADVYERGVSINGLSKGFGLAGLRVGWAACRDRELLADMLTVKSKLSSCLSSTSEILAHIALCAEEDIVARTRAVGRGNISRLDELIARFPDLFQASSCHNLAFSFPRYLGLEGSYKFAKRLAEEAGLLVLPSTLWKSRLAPIADQNVRIGAGQIKHRAALDALEKFLTTSAKT